MTSSAKLTEQERLFCSCYARCADGPQAAAQAGYPEEQAAKAACKLLAKPRICNELARCREEERRELEGLALAGLRRIAFGGVGDAVRLITEEDLPPGRAAQLDLFAVSEIKRPRGGGWEIKFHDRLRALALLLEHSPQSETADSRSLLEALDKSAAALALHSGGTGGADGV